MNAKVMGVGAKGKGTNSVVPSTAIMRTALAAEGLRTALAKRGEF